MRIIGVRDAVVFVGPGAVVRRLGEVVLGLAPDGCDVQWFNLKTLESYHFSLSVIYSIELL